MANPQKRTRNASSAAIFPSNLKVLKGSPTLVSFWSRNKNRFLAGLFLLVMGLMGFGCYLLLDNYYQKSRVNANLQETQQAFDGSKDVSPEERAGLLKKVFEKQSTLSAGDQKSLREEMFKKFGERINNTALEFSRLKTDEEKQAFLDKQIEEAESMRRTFEAMRTLGGIGGLFGGGNQGVPGQGNHTGSTAAGSSNSSASNSSGQGSSGTSSSGPGNWNNASAEQRENWMKSMLSNTTPIQRASMDQFRSAMEQRRSQLGLGNSGWGPGR